MSKASSKGALRRVVMALTVTLGLFGGAASADPVIDPMTDPMTDPVIDPVFDPAATLACVAGAQAAAPTRTGHAVLDCVGRSAQACMMTPAGQTTVGMVDCLGRELAIWAARLEAAHGQARTAAETMDAEMREIGSAAPSLADSLEAMQVAWAAFRDAACLHEQAQWMGGTGGGPATMACHLQETARQTLRLEGWWSP